MLDSNDLKQIGAVIDDRFKKAEDRIVERTATAVVTQVGEFIDQNLLPAIDKMMDEKLEEKLEAKLEEKLEAKLEEKLTDKIRPLPDRDFMIRQTAEVKGEIVTLVRKEDEKANLHIKFSHENKTLTEEQWKALRALQVFPSIEI